jgi:SNF2 family DNA or RNA helicase
VAEVDVEFEFELGLDESERHVVSVFELVDGMRSRITRPQELWDYGKAFERGGTRYRVAFKTIEILQALRSLNPQITPAGALVFDFLPPVLAFLRKRRDVRETEASSALKISDAPLQPLAIVDYDPLEGIHVCAGYKRDGADRLLRRCELNLTRDGGYARSGNTFHPVGTISDRVSRWLEAEKRTIPLAGVPEFFVRDLVLLRSDLSAVLTDQAQRVRIVSAPLKPRVSVQRNEPGWLDFVVEYESGGYILPEDAVRTAVERGTSHARLDDFTFVAVDHEAFKHTEAELKVLGAVPLADHYRLPITMFSSLEEFIDRIGGSRVLSEEYATFLSELTGFEPDESFALSPQAEENLKRAGLALRPYQRAGIHWLNWLRENHLHGILADDMGLGKTVQAICAVNIAHERQEVDRPSLIVCPRSVVPFWVREVRKWVPNIRILAYGGPARDRSVWRRAGKCWFVTTYETLSRDIDVISETPFYYAILDEATRIKNPDAQRTQAIKSINAMHRLALSGTPVENRLGEMWSIFDFLIKGLFGSQSEFAARYETPIVEGDKKAAEDLAKRIRPFLLRRLKADVAKDLPEKIEIEDWCDLTTEQRSLYGQIQDRLAKPLRAEIEAGKQLNYQFYILPILTKLKQVCDHPALVTGNMTPLYGRSEKFDTTIERIQEIRAGRDHAVVFTHFLKTLDLFECALAERGITNIRIDGSTQDRQALIDRFNDGLVGVALCSIQACGYGITLTAANHVIHFDRWWNPAVEDQATDRVHRIGQDKTVYVYRTMVSGTLEEKISVLLERKRDLADRVIGAAIGQPMHWTRDELLELLRPLN